MAGDQALKANKAQPIASCVSNRKTMIPSARLRRCDRAQCSQLVGGQPSGAVPVPPQYGQAMTAYAPMAWRCSRRRSTPSMNSTKLGMSITTSGTPFTLSWK